MIINGGTGNGYAVGVTGEGRLKSSCVTFTMEHHVNHSDEESYSAGVSVTPNAGASTPTCLLYIKNDSDKDMIITENMFTVDTTNVTVTLKQGDEGTPANTASMTITNRNAGSCNEADVTAYIGADGSGVTGMSGGSAIQTIKVIAGLESKYYSTMSGFIIPKNKIYTIWASGDCTGLRVGTGISFHSIGE